MDPLSITTSVFAIISGIVTTYKAGSKYFEKWRTKREEKKKKTAEEELRTSLESAPTEVDNKCQTLARVHGSQFHIGDGMYPLKLRYHRLTPFNRDLS